MAQDNELKVPVMVGTPENAAGAQSGVTTLIPVSTSPVNGVTDLNGTASSENLSAQYKFPSVSQEIPAEANNQYC